jgi:hypothetical protein
MKVLTLAAAIVFSTSAHAAPASPTESGQAAFAALHEIVEMLKADPGTDWSKVNIDALRAHLADMDAVTLHARVAYTPLPNGERIRVTGDGAVKGAIQRMLTMHAGMAGDTPDYRMTSRNTANGVELTVIAKSARGLARVRGLGLFGMLAEGNHHQKHHLMLAKGAM